VKGLPPAQAEGNSKRDAQKAAATKLLELAHKK
jgi:dsRNA-specific ribonuclease